MNTKMRTRPRKPAGVSSVSLQPTGNGQDETPFDLDDFAVRLAVVSSALVTVFRGKFCDAILPNRKRDHFREG